MQIVEVIRRWQAGESARSVARASGLSRNSVDKYLRLAVAAGVSQGGEPPDERLIARLVAGSQPGPRPGNAAAPRKSVLRGQRERIASWLRDDQLQLTRVHELLLAAGIAASYTTLRAFVRESGLGKPSKTTVRMAEWPPGEAAEMDFGKLGMLVEATTGKRRPVWALIVTLPASRHQFVWPMYRQTLEENIGGLEAAWRFFKGIPKRLILDNFAAAVAGPDAYDPRLTRGFLEYSQARGFFSDPARVRKPRDKPHVERAVPYVRERFFKGASFRDLEDCREQAERWCRDIAGLRVHGTTRKLPREVFEADEQPTLQPYDGILYDVPEWKEVSVHPDHHISFGQALYSAPSATCPPGTKLEVRGDRALVKLYKKGELVKVHPRQPRGARVTDPDDYPAEKTTYALRHPDRIVRGATILGPSVETLAKKLFEGPLPWAKLRAGQKLLGLGEKYGGARLDAACKRALAYEITDVRRVHRILLQALDREQQPTEEQATPLGSRFARPGSDFDRRPMQPQEAAG
jgi:transposase